MQAIRYFASKKVLKYCFHFIFSQWRLQRQNWGGGVMMEGTMIYYVGGFWKNVYKENNLGRGELLHSHSTLIQKHLCYMINYTFTSWFKKIKKFVKNSYKFFNKPTMTKIPHEPIWLQLRFSKNKSTSNSNNWINDILN